MTDHITLPATPGSDQENAFNQDGSPPRKGVLAALWLPTDEDGQLKKEALKRHLDWLKTTGVHGVLALGTTAEFVRFSIKTKVSLLAEIAELAAPLPMLTNITSIRFDEAVELGNAAKKLGSPGVSIMPPYFFPLTQDDILAFFLKVADSVDLPFYLYNFPEITGNRIGLKTIASFADAAPMVGIKQSGTEFGYHKDLVALGNEKNFSVFSGFDLQLPSVFSLGVKGAIGGLANFVPDLMVQIYNICIEKASGDVDGPAAKMAAIGEAIEKMNLPLNVAPGIAARGFDPGAPKTVISAQTMRNYRLLQEELEGLFSEWKLDGTD